MRWWHLHMCVCGRTRTLLICKMKQWFQRDRKQCHNTLSWPPPLSPSERLPTCCVHTSVCLSVCIHKINELCVCIVRVRRPSVYIKNVTWPWQAEAGFLRRTGRGKKGRPLFTAASAVALNQWRPPATLSLPPPLMPPPSPFLFTLPFSGPLSLPSALCSSPCCTPPPSPPPIFNTATIQPVHIEMPEASLL